MAFQICPIGASVPRYLLALLPSPEVLQGEKLPGGVDAARGLSMACSAKRVRIAFAVQRMAGQSTHTAVKTEQ